MFNKAYHPRSKYITTMFQELPAQGLFLEILKRRKVVSAVRRPKEQGDIYVINNEV